jgi:L-alanine-DL-glutamate epimerase-like enolase superfamily enzyme
LFIGQLGLNVAGMFSMNIHTRQKPAVEIAKWGMHGRNYDVIVIELLGSGARNINIENWINADYAFLISQIRMKASISVHERPIGRLQ